MHQEVSNLIEKLFSENNELEEMKRNFELENKNLLNTAQERKLVCSTMKYIL